MSSTLGDRLLWRDGDFRLSQCACCRNKARDSRTCPAFPEGIPAAVLVNAVPHTEPIEGDRGVRLDPFEIDRGVFERMTGLNWPAGRVSYSDLEQQLSEFALGRAERPAVVEALRRADFVIPVEGPLAPDAVSLVGTQDSDDRPCLGLFTSQEKLSSHFGSVVKHVRMTLDNFPEGFGDVPLVVNPRDDTEFSARDGELTPA
jgi:hypothetical protein